MSIAELGLVDQAVDEQVSRQGIASIPCVHDTEPQGFTAYTPPVSYSIDKKNEKGLFKFHLYDIDQARENHLGQSTVQFLMCAAGGVDAGNGSRIRVSGPGMTFNESNASHILGARWKEGKTPEDYSITLGFEAPLRGATVKGSIQQHPSNSLKGSISPPYGSEKSEFHENAVNAWWKDGCRPRAPGGAGATTIRDRWPRASGSSPSRSRARRSGVPGWSRPTWNITAPTLRGADRQPPVRCRCRCRCRCR